jgi:hypothetical protein
MAYIIILFHYFMKDDNMITRILANAIIITAVWKNIELTIFLRYIFFLRNLLNFIYGCQSSKVGGYIYGFYSTTLHRLRNSETNRSESWF